MRQVAILAALLITAVTAKAQTERFDIATFVPPVGWQRMTENGVLVFHDYKTNNDLTSFCQIYIFPSRASSGEAATDFKEEWNAKVVLSTGTKAKPASQTEKTPEGWTVTTGYATVTTSGITYNCILVTASGFGRAMSVMVNAAGNDHAEAVEKFFNDLDLDTDTEVKPPVIKQDKVPDRSVATSSGMVTLNDYDFTAPNNWRVQKNKDDIQIRNMNAGCLIMMLSPQPSSGDLEQDANAVFDMMYTGWNYQYTDDRQFTLSKGVLPKGLAFAMKEAPMNRTTSDGQYHTEEGAAMVVQVGSQIVIVAVRHSSLVGHSDCHRRYDTWRRFFNSFTVRNVAIPKNTEEQPSKRIVGVWKMDEAGAAISEYVFAANGNYQHGGAIGTSSTTSDSQYKYTHYTTYSFQGDGKYVLSGNQLSLSRHNGKDKEQMQFRFEMVKHGNTGWKERLYFLKTDSSLAGGPYEVRYEKYQ